MREREREREREMSEGEFVWSGQTQWLSVRSQEKKLSRLFWGLIRFWEGETDRKMTHRIYHKDENLAIGLKDFVGTQTGDEI